MKRPLLLGVGVIILLVTAASLSTDWLSAPRHRGAPQHGSAVVALEDNAARASTDSKRVARSTRLERAPRMALPPVDVPLASYFPALIMAARAGDVGAECRAALEIRRCTLTLRQQQDAVRLWTSIATEDGKPNEKAFRADYLARKTADLQKTEAICADVQMPADLEPWRLLRDAARAGHVPSMLTYVSDYPLDNHELLQHLDQLEIYRNEAPVFLERAAASGDPYGVAAMYWALQGQPAFIWPFFEPVPHDPVKLLAYNLALRDVMDAKGKEFLAKKERMLRRKLSGEDQRKAEAMSNPIQSSLVRSRGMDMKFGLSSTFDDGSDCSRS